MNSAWSDGYVTDINYTPGFYREQLPGHLEYVALMQGQRPPNLTGGFTWCELGCGLGVTAVIAAATHPQGRFWALDFNPGHVAYGADLAAAAGIDNVTFQERSFAEAVDSDDYPGFDIITLHGIYSWINIETRQDIQRFIRKHLKPGGLVFVSYNTHPGWARLGPLQHWMATFAETVPGNSVAKTRAGIEFLNRMREAGALYFPANAGADKHLEGLAQRPPAYLAHEYLNASWHPLYVTEVMAEMDQAKLVYCGSASIIENIDGYCLNQAAQDQVRGLSSRPLQELYRDFFANRNFRRDVYLRGAIPMSSGERRARLDQMRIGLAVVPDQVTYTTKCAIGEIGFDSPHCRAVVAALANGPRSVGDLRGEGVLAGLSDNALLAALHALIISNTLIPVGSASNPGAARDPAARLNREILARSRGGDNLPALASPRLGTGIPLPASDLMLLDNDWSQDNDTLARTIAERLRAIGHSLIVNGRTLSDPADLLNHIRGEADQFRANRLPMLRLAGIVD